jgi:hypothetical protein
MKADPKDNASVLIAYDNADLFNNLGRKWVCWGDLRTDHLPVPAHRESWPERLVRS